MVIDGKQLASKPKKVGTWGGRDVLAIATKGGFHAVGAVTKGSGAFETIGTGPHPAVARAIANRHHQGIEWTSLEKSDYVDPAHFQHLMPKYEEITNTMRRLGGFQGK